MSDAIRPERLRELFLSLVETYSPSGKEESVLAYLEDFFAREKCPYGIQPVDEERYNLVLGWPDAPLVFVGHVDTVDVWDLEDIGPEDLGDGWVRGLGAVDMKGGCAALVEAYLSLRRDGLGREFGLALLVGEEEEGDGAEAFLQEARPGRALVGEPTNLRLCTGHYGYLEVIVSARGRRVHASIPERGENAAEQVLAVLHEVLQASELQGEGGPVVSIRHLETTNPGFAVPARAAAWIDVHMPPGWSASTVQRFFSEIVDQQGEGRVTLEYPTEHAGFDLLENDPLIAAYRAAGGEETDVFRSHSDANRFFLAGIPTALLGPGRLEYAHTEEERIAFDQVVEAARRYRDLALAFRGALDSSGLLG